MDDGGCSSRRRQRLAFLRLCSARISRRSSRRRFACRLHAQAPILERALRRVRVRSKPKWRNWQTQQTQNLPTLWVVGVRFPPLAPAFARPVLAKAAHHSAKRDGGPHVTIELRLASHPRSIRLRGGCPPWREARRWVTHSPSSYGWQSHLRSAPVGPRSPRRP